MVEILLTGETIQLGGGEGCNTTFVLVGDLEAIISFRVARGPVVALRTRATASSHLDLGRFHLDGGVARASFAGG